MASWFGGGTVKHTEGTMASFPVGLITFHLLLWELSSSTHSSPRVIVIWEDTGVQNGWQRQRGIGGAQMEDEGGDGGRKEKQVSEVIERQMWWEQMKFKSREVRRTMKKTRWCSKRKLIERETMFKKKVRRQDGWKDERKVIIREKRKETCKPKADNNKFIMQHKMQTFMDFMKLAEAVKWYDIREPDTGTKPFRKAALCL